MLPESYKYHVKHEACDAFNTVSYDVFPKGSQKDKMGQSSLTNDE